MQNQYAAAGQPSLATTDPTPAPCGTIRPVVPTDLPALLVLIAARGERLLLIEMSGDTAQEAARALYRQAGYDEEARIREFYAAGTDKLVFRKALPTKLKEEKLAT